MLMTYSNSTFYQLCKYIYIYIYSAKTMIRETKYKLFFAILYSFEEEN